MNIMTEADVERVAESVFSKHCQSVQQIVHTTIHTSIRTELEPVLHAQHKTNNSMQEINLNVERLRSTLHGIPGTKDDGMYGDVKKLTTKVEELETFKIKFVSKVVGGTLVAQAFLLVLGWIASKLLR